MASNSASGALPSPATNPPLPPRKNLHGLPPTYLHHLRRLLNQWLKQQLRSIDSQNAHTNDSTHAGLPEDDCLWTDERVAQLERAIWEGAVLTPPSKDAMRERGLLEQDWAEWTPGSARRRAAWKAQEGERQRKELSETEERAKQAAGDGVGAGGTGGTSGKGKTPKQASARKGSTSEPSPLAPTRGRLAVPPVTTTSGSPLTPSSSVSTPSRLSTRASSVASGRRSPRRGEREDELLAAVERVANGGGKGEGREESDAEAEEQLKEWCRVISGLEGYEKLVLPKKDEWEVVEDDFIPHGTIQRDIPGAFPQSSNYDYLRRSLDRSTLSPAPSPPPISPSTTGPNPAASKTFSSLGLPSAPSRPKADLTPSRYAMVKPVFCLHFTPVTNDCLSDSRVGSSSTLRLKGRDQSVGARSTGTAGSAGAKWWSGSVSTGSTGGGAFSSVGTSAGTAGSSHPSGGYTGTISSSGMGTTSSSSKWSDLFGTTTTTSTYPDPIREGDETPLPEVEVDFVEGRYALPSGRAGESLSRKSSRRGRPAIKGKRRKSILDVLKGTPESGEVTDLDDTEEDGEEDGAGRDGDEEGESEDETSNWSGTQRGPHSSHASHSNSRERNKAWSTVVSGAEDDIPRDAMEDGQVGLVGGTIVVRGVGGEEERRGLERVLQLVIYAISSMSLELDLLDAFRVPREPDEPPLPPPPPSIPPKPQSADSSPGSAPHSPSRRDVEVSRNRSLRERGKKDRDRDGPGGREKGFFSRLGKESKGVWEGLLGKKGRGHGYSQSQQLNLGTGLGSGMAAGGSLPSSPVSSQQPSPAQALPAINLPSPSSPPASTPGGTLSTLPTPTSATSTPALTASSTPSIPHPTDRHLLTLTHLESLAHSTTPGLKLPMPPLLLRVREEDRLRREKAKGEVLRGEAGGLGLGLGTSPGQALPQHASTGNSQRFPQVDPLRGRALGYRLGGDVKAGLGVLAPGLDTLEGWMRLQRLETLVCEGIEEGHGDGEGKTGDKSENEGGNKGKSKDEEPTTTEICHRPKPRTLIFFSPTHDLTIREYLSELGEELGEENMVCPRSGCAAGEVEHVRWWVHGGERVGVRIEGGGGGGEGEEGQEGGEVGKWEEVVEAWVKCKVCGAASEPRKLGEGAKAYSWGKLLELLLYTTILQPPSLCVHAQDKSQIVHYLRHFPRPPSSPSPSPDEASPHSQSPTPTPLTISLTTSPLSILDARLPKLQVGPNVPKRKAGKEPAAAAVDGLVKREVREERREGVEADLEGWFGGMEARLGLLRSHLASKEASDSKADKKPADTPAPESEASKSLAELLTDSQLAKSALLSSLSTTPPSQINDVRIQLALHIKQSSGKLAAWQKKHGAEEVEGWDKVEVKVPEYAVEGGKVHALPGSGVLVREDEPSSIIAYTLSSLAYFNELTSTSKTPATTAGDESAPTAGLSKSDSGLSSALSTSASTTDDPLPSPAPSPAPASAASTPTAETWSIKCERRESPRDLLSLRSIVKKRSDASLALAPPGSALPLSLNPPPNAPSAEVSLQQAEGHSESGGLGELVKTISKAAGKDAHAELASLGAGSRRSSMSESEGGFPGGGAASALSRVKGMGMRTPSRRMTNDGDSAPPSAFRPSARSVSSTAVTTSTTPTPSWSTSTGAAASSAAKDNSWGSVTSSFSSSFNNLLKLGSDMSGTLGSIRVRGTDRSLSQLMGPLNMTASGAGHNAMDTSLSSVGVEQRPHLAFTFAAGDKLRFGCQVYYATAFDSLRRRCAIDKSVVASLARTDAWDAQGGKSKAAFFMTQDKRYLVKELVSKWTVSDTHAMLEIAPAYFAHLAGTHNRATSLAKIVGFYTVSIKDTQSGTKRQLDLLVMENLFYKQTISKTFDLKGIEGRKMAKAKVDGDGKEGKDGKADVSGTLFDADWIEGMQKGLVLLQPHAKRILLEAISLDTKFLSQQSIMDYSLLLGLDEGRHELVVGLVDAIGSFNFFKTIESRGKMALNRGGDVTIIPPDQYRERFENAIKQYFVACPDKWSKTSRKGRVRVDGLPSVL
ncbi:hypothetical protein IAT38_007402 [Cryptococcus sp. DSM 104549]